jgi:hypothetical protein
LGSAEKGFAADKATATAAAAIHAVTAPAERPFLLAALGDIDVDFEDAVGFADVSPAFTGIAPSFAFGVYGFDRGKAPDRFRDEYARVLKILY